MTTARALPPARSPAMTEAELAEHVRYIASLYDWRVAHFRSVPVVRPDGSIAHRTPVAYDGAGFPDLVLVHPKRRLVLFRELKSAKGRLRDEQVQWANDLNAAGADYAEWRPSDRYKIDRLLSDGKARLQ